ncbi:MAG TPA: sugar ABC transporter substrate-binding protein, partial [Lachnospiraceae bacterium]|nr:sugar ABC transporter substrate-binding protein [Lachnospiraceae bacterium]
MEQAFRHAAESPLHILEKTQETLTLVRTAARKGSMIAVSDAGCA